VNKIIMIRIMPENYDAWLAAHNAGEQARLEYGITEGPLYRDVKNPNVALVTFHVEDAERAQRWFQDERFKAAMKRCGKVEREFYVGERK
jgi:hypothetical protein